MTELVLSTDCTPEQREYLAIVKDSANALLVLINDILDFSKVESGRLDLELIDFDLRGSLEEIVKFISYRASQRSLQIIFNMEPDVPAIVKSDPVKLRQILLNLLGNAIKFTEKGRIELHVACDARNLENCDLHFAVRDSGIGISQENVGKIFDAFAQADSSTTRKFGGTGLGLAICQGFVRLMGGKIWATSQLGLGSEFHFTIKCSLGSIRNFPTRAAEAKTKASQVSELTVLIAEDNPANRMLTRHALEAAGFQVYEVENGRDAIEEVTRNHFDLILMDIRMPVMDGYLATRQIRQLPGAASQTPIIALTASAFKEDRDKTNEAGMDDFISKPFQAEDLVAKCKEWCKLSFSEEDAKGRPSNASAFQDGDLLTKYSPEFVKDLLEMFLETAPPVFQDLVDALHNENWEGARRSAHWLRGGASRILNPALQQELGRIEQAYSDPANIVESPNITSLRNAFRAACHHAETWLFDQRSCQVTN